MDLGRARGARDVRGGLDRRIVPAAPAAGDLDSLVAPGCIVSGIVRNSVLSPNVIVRSWAQIDESVIMDRVVVGRHCKIKKAIIDKNNVIPAKTTIGYNPSDDRKRFTVTPRGIVVIPKGYFREEE